jgi:hypothetical protein
MLQYALIAKAIKASLPVNSTVFPIHFKDISRNKKNNRKQRSFVSCKKLRYAKHDLIKKPPSEGKLFK